MSPIPPNRLTAQARGPAGRRALRRYEPFQATRGQIEIDLLLDYPVAAVNWADQGAGNPTLAEVWGRTDTAVMGGVDQTRLDEMAASEVALAAREAASVGPTRVFVTAGCSIPRTTPTANRAALVSSVRD